VIRIKSWMLALAEEPDVCESDARKRDYGVCSRILIILDPYASVADRETMIFVFEIESKLLMIVS